MTRAKPENSSRPSKLVSEGKTDLVEDRNRAAREARSCDDLLEALRRHHSPSRKSPAGRPRKVGICLLSKIEGAA